MNKRFGYDYSPTYIDWLSEDGPTVRDAGQRPDAPALTASEAALIEHNRKAQARTQKDIIDRAYWTQQAEIAAREKALHEWLMANDPAYAERQKLQHSAGIDWGLLPAAAKVTAAAIATAATGGLAAPSVATLWSDVKKGIGSIDSVKGGVSTALRVKDYVKDEFAAANAMADRVLSDLDVGKAQAVVANTHALALAGDVDAQRAAVILAKVAGERVKAGVGPGQPLIPVLTPEQASIVAKVEAESLRPMTAAEKMQVSDVRQSWWQRFLEWIGL